ncbi:MlaD family protein [Elusimicrobiota bacterium]
MSNETKLGGFVLAGLIAFMVSVMLLGDFQFQRRYHVDILFSNVAGLPAKASVKIAGVEVGGVKSISLEGDKAKVRVWIKKDIIVHEDTIPRVVATGIIGSKYLELTKGTPGIPQLKSGSVISGEDPVSFDNLMRQLESLVKPLKGEDGRESIGVNLSVTMENLRKVSDSLKTAISDQERRVVAIVKNVDKLTKNIADITDENKENIKVAVTEIRGISEKLNRMLEKIEKGEGTIGKLVSDEKMGEDLKVTVEDLRATMKQTKKVMSRFNLIETEWDYVARYDGDDKITRSDVGFRIKPRPDKFYYVGVSNLADDNWVDDTETKNTIDFLIGKDFGPAKLYAGAIRSKAGFGASIKPLWKWEPWRRLEITADAYHFRRTDPVARPKINVGAKVQVAKWAYVGSKVEDVYSEPSVNTYGNIVIADDDIAYILGLVGLAKP